jgi:glycerophosphoryl diester phosphodiesterase
MQKLIVAHRGASADARENTLEAFQKAVEFGADMVELDVRKSKDGVLVVFHDEVIDGKKIRSLTYADLNAIAKTRQYQVPTLEQALACISGKLSVQIELKETGYESRVADLALSSIKSHDFYIISFNLSSLKVLRRQYPEVRTGLIMGSSLKRIWATRSYLWAWRSVRRYVDMVSINKQLWPSNVAGKLSLDAKVFVWTVDDASLCKDIINDQNIAGVVTNTVRSALKAREELYVPR